MESCSAVEKEVDKVINKFSAMNDHSQRVISDVIVLIEKLRSSIAEGKFMKIIHLQQQQTINIYLLN